MYRDIMLTVMNRKASHARDVSLETGKLFMKDALGIDDVSLNYFANLRRSKSVYHQHDYAN